MAELERIAKYYHDLSNIPITIIGKNGVESEYGDRVFQPSLAEFYVQSILNDTTDISVDVTLSEEFVICGFVIEKKSHRALVLGPVMEHACTRKTALDIIRKLGVSYNRTDELLRFFDKIPCTALTIFIKNLYFLNYIINEELPPDENWYREIADKIEKKHIDEYQNEYHLTHNPREWDKILESCIEFGKMDELEEFMNHIRSEGKMGITANDSIRSFKNVAISSVALISRAAARGGLDYETALTLSDEYIRNLECCNTFEEINQLLGQSFFDFSKKVNEIRSLNSDSKVVYLIHSYIVHHLYEPIFVSNISAETGYNESYLCRLFKKETGKTLKEYINEMKIEEAKYLLKASPDSIVDISANLGFSSQSYFSTIFKKYTQISPNAYREQLL